MNKKLICPLCGGEVKFYASVGESSGFSTLMISMNYKCKCGLSYNIEEPFSHSNSLSQYKRLRRELLKRFTTRPESVHEMFRRLFNIYSTDFIYMFHKKICEIDNFKYTGISSSTASFQTKQEQEAISILQKIEKELARE